MFETAGRQYERRQPEAHRQKGEWPGLVERLLHHDEGPCPGRSDRQQPQVCYSTFGILGPIKQETL